MRGKSAPTRPIKMKELEFAVRLAVVALAAASILLMVFQSPKRWLHVIWAVFCASIAISMIQQVAGATFGSYRHLVGLGACATCNGFWLVSCALFRRDNPFTAWRLGLAGTVALLVVACQLLRFTAANQLIDPTVMAVTIGGFSEALGLVGSAVLVLTIREGIVGWADANRTERRMRLAFSTLR